MANLVARMVGAAGFNARSYEEVEADSTANMQAIAVVILSSVGAAIGIGAVDFRSLVGLLAGAIVTWLVWVALTVFIGTKLLPGTETKSNFGEILRTTGFSSSVGVLRALGIVPVIGPLLFSLVTIWMLLTFVIAIRQALDYTSTARALAVCLLGWIIHAILFLGLARVAI